MNFFRCFSTCLCTLFAIALAQAQESYFRDIYDAKSNSYVEVISLFSKLPSSGYAPIRVTIANRTTKPASLSFTFDSEVRSYFNSQGKLSVNSAFQVSCQANTVHTVDLMVPVAAAVKTSSYSSSVSCSQSLNMQMLGVAIGSYEQSSETSPAFPNVLLSESLHTPNSSKLDAAVITKISGSSSGYSRGSALFGGKFNPTTMPDDWRSYVGFDTLIMTDNEWKALDPGPRAAILQWNRLGGQLHLFALNTNSTLPSLGIVADNPTSVSKNRGMGGAYLHSIASSLDIDADKIVDEVSSGKDATWQAKSLTEDYSSGWGLQSQFGSKTFHFIFFILVLIAFGVLVGPVNLFVFAKSGMRHKLFFTTPIIALGASFAMILLIFIQDGLGGKGQRAQLMEINSEDGDNNAYIHQEQISRSGVLFGNRFEINEACAVTPVPLANTQWTRLTVDSSTDQKYGINHIAKGLAISGDWFQSRSEQAQSLAAVIPTRARIEQAAGGNVAALNSSFDYELDSLVTRSVDGKFWRADHIAAGKNFLCREITEAEYRDFAKDCGTVLALSYQEKLEVLSNRPGHFIAVSHAAPMVETFRNIKWTDNTSIITGRILTQEQP